MIKRNVGKRLTLTVQFSIQKVKFEHSGLPRRRQEQVTKLRALLEELALLLVRLNHVASIIVTRITA